MGNALSKQRFKSVWDAIEDTPGEAANMKARVELMRGKVNVFSIDTLVNMLAAAEIRLELGLKKAA